MHTVLVTHAHPDHCSPSALLWRHWVRPGGQLTVAGPDGVVEACRPWLVSEFALLRPRVVVVLGATAAKALLGPDFRVTRQRGQVLPWPGSAQHPDDFRVAPIEGGVEVRCTPLLPNYIAIGTGYGLEPDWRHGMYQGPDLVVQGVTYDVAAIKQLGAYAVVDHAARFEYEGKVGHGLLEHSFSTAYPRYGLE